MFNTFAAATLRLIDGGGPASAYQSHQKKTDWLAYTYIHIYFLKKTSEAIITKTKQFF